MYTEEQRREALRDLDEYDGRVTAAMGKPGYPSRQCFYQWINERDAAHVRKNGRPFSHYGEQTKDDAIRLLDSGMDTMDMAGHPATGHRLSEPTASSGISEGSHGYRRAAIAKGDKYAGIRPLAVGASGASGKTRGYCHVTHGPRGPSEPVAVPGEVAWRMMPGEGRRVTHLEKTKRYGSYGGGMTEAPDNLVARDSHADAPDEPWPPGMTGPAIPAGKRHLSPILDRSDGKLVSWGISTSPNAGLADGSLGLACGEPSPDGHPVIRTDRGRRYRRPGWISVCGADGPVRSMSRKACPPDDSAMEGSPGRLKDGFSFHRDRKGVTMERFVPMPSAYPVSYDEGRIKESLGWLSPSDYRRSLGLAA